MQNKININNKNIEIENNSEEKKGKKTTLLRILKIFSLY